jgi:PAS domain S-box-containing protein
LIREGVVSTPKVSFLKALGRISHVLDQCGIHDKKIIDALGVLGRTIGAQALALSGRYSMDSGDSALECLGFWEDDKQGRDTSASGFLAGLSMEDISSKCWEALENRDPVRLDGWNRQTSKEGLSVFLWPLFLENDLFGFLSVQNTEKNLSHPARKAFLAAVCRVVELWISKENIQKRFEDLIAFLPNATIGVNTDGVGTVWNPAVEAMTGWKADRIIGKGNYEYALPFYAMRRPLICDLILHPDPKWEATYPEYRKEGDVVHSLIFTPALTGGGAFLNGSTRKMRNLNGKPFGSIHIVRDITRERQMESQLHSSESMFRTITDYAGLGIALFQREKALYYNERFEALLGISGREITLQDLISAVYSEDRKDIGYYLERMFQGLEKGPLRMDLRASLLDEQRHFSSYAQVLEFEGKLTVCFVLDDITEQKALAEKVRQNELRHYHEDRLTALGIMAAGIAHELNQPLNTVRVVTDGFLFGRDEEWNLDQDELFDGLEMISRQVIRMSEVIQNIRNFAREDREQTPGEVSANEAIENVFSMIGRQLEAHGVFIEKDLAVGLPAIRTNMNRLEQVIMNLIVNARQALDECPHEYRRLKVKTKTKDGRVLIEVSDNATGIPEDLIVRVFDPFFTTKEVGKGTGLGLSISRSIVSELGGTMEAFNNDNGGATFLINAPASGGLL